MDYDIILANNAYELTSDKRAKMAASRDFELELYKKKKKNSKKIKDFLKVIETDIYKAINFGKSDINILFTQDNPLHWDNEIFEDKELLEIILNILKSKGYVITENDGVRFDDSWVIKYVVSWEK